jgi:hypothetical protein
MVFYKFIRELSMLKPGKSDTVSKFGGAEAPPWLCQGLRSHRRLEIA